MSHALTLKIPDEVYQVIARTAQATGRTTEDLAAEWLGRLAPRPRLRLSLEEAEAARQRFRRYFGAWDSGDPNSADNAGIDRDLAREYGSTLEDHS